MKKVVLAAVLSVAAIFGASAQKLVGDLSPLKGQKKVNLVVKFSENLLVNSKAEAKFLEEELAQKTTEAEKTKLLDEWNKDMRTQAKGSITKAINDKVSQKHFSVGDFPDAEYTIEVLVEEIYIGYYAVISSKASFVKSTVNFSKTGETNSFATIQYKKTSNPFSSDIPYWITRVTMSFASLGLQMSHAINKALK